MQEPKGNDKQGGHTPPSQSGLSWSSPAQNQTPVPPLESKPASVGKVAPTPKVQVMPSNKKISSPTKYAGMVALGIIAGVIIAWGWSALRPSPGDSTATADTNVTATTSDNTTTGVSEFGLTVASPQIAGNSVAITKAEVSSPTWIVIYENNAGQPGNALGAALFFAENQGGTVELLRGTRAGRSYLATLQVDNGDRKFSLKDDRFLSADGTAQWVTFEVK